MTDTERMQAVVDTAQELSRQRVIAQTETINWRALADATFAYADAMQAYTDPLNRKGRAWSLPPDSRATSAGDRKESDEADH